MYLCCSLYSVLQDKLSVPASFQLQPRPYSLVTVPLSPLCDSDISLVQTSRPLDSSATLSMVSNTSFQEGLRVVDLLPAVSCFRDLFVSASDVRKKMSVKQLEDVMTMLGSGDYVR